MRYPSLYQINTRVRLTELAKELKRPATLDDVTDAELDRLSADRFDLVWFLGVWQTGPISRRIAASGSWRQEYERAVPDLHESDIVASCFSVADYRVNKDFGGDAALARLRERMRKRGLRLILDFVPNHLAPDHAWVKEHPDWFVTGDEEKLAKQPQNYKRIGDRILAYGRDPYFDGWSDTFQLNYGNEGLQDAMFGELKRIATQCDGVRCDMAMLVLPDVFQRTWGIAMKPFWPRVTAAVHKQNPQFTFLAEVYWDLEWTLQLQGFDYTYDKRLYDRLEHSDARAIRGHLSAGLDFQDHLVRFLENHDEPRAATAFQFDKHRAAAVITFYSPGLRFFHQGEREGKTVRIPMQAARGPVEPCNEAIAKFYDRIVAVLKDDAFRDGDWQLLDCRRAWAENPTSDDFIAFAWTRGDDRRLAVVNYSAHPSQCYVALPWTGEFRLQDLLSSVAYDRSGDSLYLDLPAWGYHVFDVRT